MDPLCYLHRVLRRVIWFPVLPWLFSLFFFISKAVTLEIAFSFFLWLCPFRVSAQVASSDNFGPVICFRLLEL